MSTQAFKSPRPPLAVLRRRLNRQGLLPAFRGSDRRAGPERPAGTVAPSRFGGASVRRPPRRFVEGLGHFSASQQLADALNWRPTCKTARRSSVPTRAARGLPQASDHQFAPVSSHGRQEQSTIGVVVDCQTRGVLWVDLGPRANRVLPGRSLLLVGWRQEGGAPARSLAHRGSWIVDREINAREAVAGRGAGVVLAFFSKLSWFILVLPGDFLVPVGRNLGDTIRTLVSCGRLRASVHSRRFRRYGELRVLPQLRPLQQAPNGMVGPAVAGRERPTAWPTPDVEPLHVGPPAKVHNYRRLRPRQW